MTGFNNALLILHFIGLTMGFSVSIGNIVMLGVMDRSTGPERPVLARFMPAISRVGRIGLGLLWVTGATMLYTKWNGIGSMPWTFHVKLTGVVVLTIAVTMLYSLERRAMNGDIAAAARVQTFGKLASLAALTALVFAVITFS